MKELFLGTGNCTANSYCSFYEELFKIIQEHPTVLNISPAAEADTKTFLRALPGADVWCITQDREQALGSIRAGARTICTTLYDIQGLNDWLGAKQFDLIVCSGPRTLIEQFRVVLLGYKRLKRSGRIIIEDVPDTVSAELLGGHIEDYSSISHNSEDRIVWFTKDEPLPRPEEPLIPVPLKYLECAGKVLYSEFSGNTVQFVSLVECISKQTVKPDVWIVVNRNHYRFPLYYLRLVGCPVKLTDEPCKQDSYIELKESMYYQKQFLEDPKASITVSQIPETTNTVPQKETIDVVIPLSNESRFNNDELRICLRSIDKYMPSVGNVWLLTSYPPDWVRNVNVIDIPDKHRHNKDANLFDKLLSAAINPKVAKTFVFFSDDQCLMAPFDPLTAKVVYNTRGPQDFGSSGKWHVRMTHTYELLRSRGITLDCNFDGHVPMVYTKEEFVKALRGVDYVPEPGYCINTLVCGILRKPKEVAQNTVKVTAESTGPRDISDKLYAGYNDTGFSSCMRDILFQKFPEKSKYEA